MDSKQDLIGQVLEISNTRDIVSLEVIQHQRVRLEFAADNAGETIKAELISKECSSNLPCFKLEHSSLHTDLQSYLTISVHPEDDASRFLNVTRMLVFILSMFLLVFCVRKWMKRKQWNTERESDSPEIKDKQDQCKSCMKDTEISQTKEFQIKNEEASCDTDEIVKVSSSSMTQIWSNQASRRIPWFLYTVILLWLSLLGITLLLGGISYQHYSDVPVLKLSFPNNKHIRHIRSYSEEPSIRDVNLNAGTDPSTGLVTRLQLVDLTSTCRDNLTKCRTHALCETLAPTDDMKCRCNRGFYLRDFTCIACSKTCQDGFYMTQQCGATADLVCKPCTQCEGSSYEVATCTSTQDTICIDVTFPLKQFQSRTHSLEDLVNWNVSLSKNVFLERLQAIRWAETPLYVSNNKQALQFIWRRPNSGLEIHVKVTEVFLIPEYVDIDHIDDKDFIKNASTVYPQDITDQLLDVKHENCRYPLPDEYDLNLEIARREATVAWEHPCDSKNSSMRSCPQGYSDGDLYVFKRLDIPCPKVNTTNSKNFGKSPNSVLCVGKNDLLTKIFGSIKVEDPTFLTFPTEECLQSEKGCLECLEKNSCTKDSNDTDCCNLRCHQTAECKQHFSESCPVPPIQCTRGDVSKFGIMPRLPSILKQFSCHLEHLPPEYLYRLTYEVKIPRMQFTLGTRNKDVMYKNFTDHQNGMDHADFLTMSHHTVSKYDDEVILTGTFINSDTSRIDEYRLHKLKHSSSFTDRRFNVIQKGKNKYLTKIQFVKPFLFSTANWWEEGCLRNVSQVVPSQPIFESYGKSVKQTVKHKTDGKFVYQIQTEDAMPHMRFTITDNTSIFSYYREKYASIRINPWSLNGSMLWDTASAMWNVTLSGSLTGCPGIFTLEIYTENLKSRLAVYDMLINCPKNFSTGFKIHRNNVDFVDIFIVVMNDSVASYRTVLSSVQGPQYFRADPKLMVAMEIGEHSPWIPITVILVICVCTSILLTMLYIYCNGQKSRHIPTDISVQKPDLGPQITLLQSMDKVSKDNGLRMKTRCVMIVLAVLYIVYAFMFTFTAVFGLLHLFQMPGVTQITLVTNTSAQVQVQMQRSLDQIMEYESNEMIRLLNSTEQRLKACSYHLKSSLYDGMPDGNDELRRVLQAVFQKNGTIKQSLAEYFASKQDFYQKEIDKFLDEFNKTLDAKLHKIQITYAAYLKSVASNDWFVFPKEIFMQQQAQSGEPLSKITDNLTGFLTWLEIDKVQEIFEIKDIVMNRLLIRMPKVDFATLFSDSDDTDSSSPNNFDFKSVNNTFRFASNNPEYKQKWREFYEPTDFNSDDKGGNSSGFSVSDIKGFIYPVFITVFLVLDLFLLVYRFLWMARCWHLFKTGLEERIPYDSMTRKIYFILTGKEVPRPEDSLDHPYDYYMHNKENIWEDNTDLYFLYCNSSTKNKEDILRDIWAHRQRQNPKPEIKEEKTNCCRDNVCKFLKCTYRFFISPVFWRLVLICGFLLILCLVAKATNDLVTVESAMFLLDTDAMIPILKRQNQMTNAVIKQYGIYLNEFIKGYKNTIDGDVQLINNLLVNVAERQTMLLTSVISDMCNLVGRETCDIDFNLVTLSLTSCNFLPVNTKPLEGFHESILDEYIQAELSPLVLNLRQILFNSINLLLVYSTGMILCQLIARVIFVNLKNSRHMKMTKVFQLPSVVDQWQEQNSFREKEIYNSQSVIAESCESGVYDMTS